MKDKNISKVKKQMEEDNFPTSGTFITKPKIIRAERVSVDEETTIDKNGEEHIGVYGDWNCIDGEGNQFYLDKRRFRSQYTPFDENSFKMIEREGYKVLLKLNDILHCDDRE